jgi:hypothetical protein
LPEVVVSLAILGLLFASLARGLDFAHRLSASHQMQAAATALLASESEFLRSLQWNQLEAFAAPSAFYEAEMDGSYTTVRQPQTLASGLRSFILTVSWSDPFAKTRHARTVVVIAAGGLST